MAKKQPNKLRIAFRKNRGNTARQNDITRAVQSEGVDVDGLDRGQRVSGKGALTRRRTVAGATMEGDQIILDVDEALCRRGRVLAAIGSTQCTVQADAEEGGYLAHREQGCWEGGKHRVSKCGRNRLNQW